MHFACNFGTHTVHTLHFQMIAVHLPPSLFSSLPLQLLMYVLYPFAPPSLSLFLSQFWLCKICVFSLMNLVTFPPRTNCEVSPCVCVC